MYTNTAQKRVPRKTEVAKLAPIAAVMPFLQRKLCAFANGI